MKVAAVQIVIFAIGLVVIELIFEIVAPLPVPGGVYLDSNGKPARVAADGLTLKPNLDIIHKGAEFTAKIHTNSLGNRVIDNENRQPDFVWLGDSFTFGHGVSDRETFPFLVCTSKGFVCQNLGHSGSNTFQEIDILVHAIARYGFRPKQVILVMLTACWIEQAGNDLGDNLRYYRAHRESTPARPSHAAVINIASTRSRSEADRQGVLKRLQSIVGNFETTKRAMLVFSSWIKSGTYQCSDADVIGQALDATKIALDKLKNLAGEFRFNVTVVEIHPYQELDGTFRKTEKLVSGVIPNTFAYIPTGKYFNKNDYYQYDGHFNAAGHARLAATLNRQFRPRHDR